MSKKALSSVVFGALLISGCAASVGPAIEVPKVPTPAIDASARGRLGVSVQLSEIKDVRTSVVSAEDSLGASFTEPQGPVGAEIEAALRKSLNERGVFITESAQTTMWGEVRRWRSQVSATSTTNVQSEASLYLEVVDAGGKRIFGGTYHGSRASQFPIASAVDIKDSLGLAMAQAISQALEDEELIAALLK